MNFNLNQDVVEALQKAKRFSAGLLHRFHNVAAQTSSPVRDDQRCPQPSRWTAENRYEIVMEILKGKEPTTQIARKHQVSDALMHRWRERFYEGGKAALNFETGAAAVSRSREQALEQKIEELEKVIGHRRSKSVF